MRHFGTAAGETADGSREEHECTETSPEEQNRWGGALVYNHVPRPTSVVHRQQEHFDFYLSSLHKCLTLHMVVWTYSEQWTNAEGKILAPLNSKGFCHRFKWDRDFCNVLFSWDDRKKNPTALRCHLTHRCLPLTLLPERFIWRLTAESKDASQFKACQCLWKTIAGDEVIRSGVIYYPMNMIISCYKYESLTSIVKAEEFMVGVKFLFPWSDPFIA